MKKTFSLLLTMILTASAFMNTVFAATDIINHNFATGGDDAASYGYDITKYGQSSVSIATTLNEDGVSQKALKISDKVGSNGSAFSVKIQKEIGRYNSGKIGFEMKFKMVIPEGAETDFASMELNFLTEKGERATRFRVTGNADGGKIRWNEYDSHSETLAPKIKKDTWYKIKLILDLDAERITGYFESEAFELGSLLYNNLKFMDVVQETDDWVITDIAFESWHYTADWYIDYIKIIENPDTVIRREKFYRPTPIQIPVSNVFNTRPVPGKVNVKKDGVYKYFNILEVDDEGNVFANVTNALRSFGLTIQISDGKYIGKTNGGEIVVVNADGTGMTINETAIPGSTYKNINGKLMVSLNKISEALGYETEWNETENILYITE